VEAAPQRRPALVRVGLHLETSRPNASGQDGVDIIPLADAARRRGGRGSMPHEGGERATGGPTYGLSSRCWPFERPSRLGRDGRGGRPADPACAGAMGAMARHWARPSAEPPKAL
jgi:hypothetical protein